uniref:ATP-binding cassette, sub-family C (CFTR/MRP), member 10 n=1 Tax=Echeneis naucrates TaxID=173247 RepID=A0A665UCN9_ECHNA
MYLDLLSDCCAILAWLVHFSAIIVLQKTAFRRTRGPPLLFLLVLLSAPNLVITLMVYCETEGYLNLTEPLKLARFVLASARTLPVLVYLLAFVFPCISDAGYALHVNMVDGSPLIQESIQQDTGEIVAEDSSGCISRLFYLWLTPLLRRGQRGELERPADVCHLPRKLRTQVVCRYFHQCWEACRRGRAASRQDEWPRPVSRHLLNGTWNSHSLQEPLELEGDVGLLRVLHKAFSLRYYMLGVLKVVVNMLSFTGPLLLSSLVNFMEEEGAPVSIGAWCALGLFVTTLLSSVLRNIFVFEVSKVALSARAALVSAIYSKALRVSGSSLTGFTLGEVVNLMSTDTDRVGNFFSSFHELWSLPFRFSITLYLLYLQVGVAFLSGLGVALLLVPFNKFLASRILSNNKDMLRHKDSRVKLMTEILFGIRVIKFYNWEPHFTQKVAERRKQELSHLKAIKYLDAMCVYTWAALPVVISILTFVTYVMLGNQLTAAKVFTTLALVGMLIIPLNCFPWVLNGILEAKVSLERIQRFFKLTNQDLQAYYALGKLLLFSCLLLCSSSSCRLSGVVYVADREAGFGLAAQEPWIQHASVRANILFGKDYDPHFYQAVIEACALSDDLNVLPNGDKTEVGENGVTLSGGQKARLALARAVYMDKDIYLLDDPLAAVDTDVAEHLMQKCIMELLRGKTRILCTHRIEFVDKADLMVLMDNGTIIKTVSFFDTTPLGRILNRFSSDLYSVDDSLPFILNILLANIFGLLGMLVVMSYGLPWVLLPLLPLALLYHRTQHFYRHTSRELKRLYSLTLSPIYSHFSETLTGLGTIRASGSSIRFEEESAKRLEQNQRCLFLSNAAMQWLDIRLQLIGVAVVTGLAVIAVVQHQFRSVDPGLVGLSLSYALSITTLLSGLIFSFTQTEMQLVSVERTEEYSTGLPTEPQHQNAQLPASWPERGLLEFRGAVLAYRDGLPNALDGVSLVVRPGEKVGIVGRTGSGKSTLFLALFRMVELNQGQILLDGLDISTVGLGQLRSRLAIIPQDPFLFSGTIRENLDPCGCQSDQQLLDVLDQCHLSSVVSRMGGLDAEAGERGKFFSVGQRQLLCLARAFLTRSKVLCIDEATASVDQKTDKLLQQTIREEFREQTVLTIAHRINTIMDCDRVLVMCGGKVAEFDTPTALLQSDSSIFHRLVGGGATERH